MFGASHISSGLHRELLTQVMSRCVVYPDFLLQRS